MARRRRAFLPATPWLAARGVVAVAAAGVVAVVLVARASGNLDPSSDVYVGVPVSAGLITTQSPVRYHGVNIGRIAEIESGTEMSRVRLAIDKGALPLIPAAVVARIVPRTFFGDIYLQLADAHSTPSTPAVRHLTPGASISIDNSADAMALYDVFKKIVDVFSRIKPERMQTALTALSQALRNRGAAIGSTIDDLSNAAGVLTPSMTRFLDTTPQFNAVMQALHTATPDILTTLSAAASVSDRLVGDQQAFVKALDALAGRGSVLTPFLADHRGQLVTVVDSAGKILATTAEQSQGITGTLSGAKAFGEAAGRVFATGKFSVTAVATFAGPMPYNAADCPVYGSTYGAYCQESDPTTPLPTAVAAAPEPASTTHPADASAPGSAPAPPPPDGSSYPAEVAPASAIVGGQGEAHALSVLQDFVTAEVPGPTTTGPTHTPNIATVLMLGPLVRGTEVRVG